MHEALSAGRTAGCPGAPSRRPLSSRICGTHSQLIEGQLRGHGVNVALFKGNMKPEEKAASLRSFKVWQSSDRLVNGTCLESSG